MASIPAPTNQAISITKIVLDKLIEGAGVEVAIAAATSQFPFLATPFVSFLFRKFVEWLGDLVDQELFNFSIKAIIRLQSTSRKDEFNESITPIVMGAPTPEELQRAKDASDRLIERNR